MTHEQRMTQVRAARAAVAAFAQVAPHPDRHLPGGDTEWSRLIDLLTGLRHLCDATAEPFEDAVVNSGMHFEASVY